MWLWDHYRLKLKSSYELRAAGYNLYSLLVTQTKNTIRELSSSLAEEYFTDVDGDTDEVTGEMLCCVV